MTSDIVSDVKSIAPVFAQPLRDQTVLDGQSATFTCKVTGSPDTVITWYKDDHLLPESEDFRQTYKDSVATLVVDEVFNGDTGIYRCEAKNKAGCISVTSQLTVQGMPFNVLKT